MIAISDFLINKEWYTFDENLQIVLTDKAPPEAVESFKRLKEAYEEGRKDDWFY
jgi:hypothetical protein